MKKLFLIALLICWAVSAAAEEENASKKDNERTEILAGFEVATANRAIRKVNVDYAGVDYWVGDFSLRRFLAKNLAVVVRHQQINMALIKNQEFVNLYGVNKPATTSRFSAGILGQIFDKKTYRVDGSVLMGADYANQSGWQNSPVLQPRIEVKMPWFGADLSAILHLGKPKEYHQVVQAAGYIYPMDWSVGVGARLHYLFWHERDRETGKIRSTYEPQAGLDVKIILPKKKIQYADSGLEMFYVYNSFLGSTASARFFYAF